MLKVFIKPERENFKIPIKGSNHAACFDCYASEIKMQDDGMVIVKLGFSTEIPEGWRADLIPRSNITKYGWVLANSPGTIDSDFRNEWQARFRPIPSPQDKITAFPYEVGERVCQVRFEKVNPVEFIVVNNTSDTERGLGGFGSTGVK